MNSNAGVSKPMLWAGRVMSAIAVLLVTFGGVVKVMKAPGIIEGMAKAGYAERLIIPVGVIELFCVVVYLIPRTNVLGAILMTALLGGATATNFRIGDPALPLPIIVGMLAWGGLYLRDARIRELIPFRRTGS